METAAVPQTFVECCQWASQIDQDHNGVVKELRRIYFLEEDREGHQGRFKMIGDEIQRLLDDLRTWTALSMDVLKSSIITSFVDKIVWSWQDADTWIRYEANQHKTQCVHVPLTYSLPLHDYAEYTKKNIHETYRFLFGKIKPSWHPECIENFNKLHDVIIPKLSRLMQCDNILRELTYLKHATPYRQHQLTEIQTFNAIHFQIPDITIPRLLTTPNAENPFAPLCQLLTGDLLGMDPLDMNKPPRKAQIPITPLTYREPLTYQAFKKLPALVSHVRHLPKRPPGRPTSLDVQGYGDARKWEIGCKGSKGPTKKRGPYKKRDKPVVVTCELVKLLDSTEALTPIKMPKLRGNLFMPLN